MCMRNTQTFNRNACKEEDSFGDRVEPETIAAKYGANTGCGCEWKEWRAVVNTWAFGVHSTNWVSWSDGRIFASQRRFCSMHLNWITVTRFTRNCAVNLYTSVRKIKSRKDSCCPKSSRSRHNADSEVSSHAVSSTTVHKQFHLTVMTSVGRSQACAAVELNPWVITRREVVWNRRFVNTYRSHVQGSG
jgi:hypothetical protein